MADTQATYLAEIFRQYGMEGLVEFVQTAIVNDWSQDQMLIELYKQPEFKTRFAGMFMLEAAGEPPVSIEEYIAYEKTAHALAAMWGVDLTKEEVDNLIGNGVSTVELEQRFDITAEAMYESDDFTIAELVRMSGAQQGDLVRYFMNPTAEVGHLQARFRQAQIAGTALRTGWGQLTQLQAEQLQEAGLTREQAQQGFGELATMGQIFAPFSGVEDIITQEDQVDFLAGDIGVAQRIENKFRGRLAEFEGSGGFAQGQQGFAVGSAEQ